MVSNTVLQLVILIRISQQKSQMEGSGGSPPSTAVVSESIEVPTEDVHIPDTAADAAVAPLESLEVIEEGIATVDSPQETADPEKPIRLKRKQVEDDDDDDEDDIKLPQSTPPLTTITDTEMDDDDDDDMIVKRRKQSISSDDVDDMKGFIGLEEDDLPVTFDDVFGDKFHEFQFKSQNMYNRDIDLLIEEMQGRVERIEQANERVADLQEAFGNDELIQKMLGESITDTAEVHNVSTISAPGGQKLNSHGGKNKFDVKNLSYLTTMPTIHNYQCLHLPLTGTEADRRIKTSGNPEVFDDRKPIQAGLHGAGHALPGAIYTPQNVIRWKKVRGKSELQSNARLLEYSNGDKIMRVGDDYFVVESHETPHENQHLMGAHGSVLLEYMKLKKSWRLRPLPKARGINNSTLDEESRKIREQTMPTLPQKAVKRFVETDKTEEEYEKDYLRTFEEMEDEANPERVIAREEKELEELLRVCFMLLYCFYFTLSGFLGKVYTCSEDQKVQYFTPGRVKFLPNLIARILVRPVAYAQAFFFPFP